MAILIEKVQHLLCEHGLDDDTSSYLLGCLEEATGADEWREAARDFLPEWAVEQLVSLAPSGKPHGTLSVMAAPIKLTDTISTPVMAEKKPASKLGWLNNGGIAMPVAPLSGNGGGGKAVKAMREPRAEEASVTVQQSRLAEVVDRSLSIDIRGVNVSFGGRTLLEDARLRLLPGRYGFIGANGAGKSTLLRLISQKRIPGLPDLQTLLVEQEDVGDEKTPVEAVIDASEQLGILKREAMLLEQGLAHGGSPTVAHLDVRAVRAEARVATLRVDGERLLGERGKQARRLLLREEDEVAQLRRRAQEVRDGAAAEDDMALAACMEALEEVKAALAEMNEEHLRAKATRLLRGLGLSAEQLRAPTADLSGGWRMRVALAKALFLEPQVLLLDEPTNHLDWGSMLWLEEYLAKLESIILIVVSHDRQFLDNFSTGIIRLVNRQLEVFKGSYSDYEAVATHLHRTREKEAEAQTGVGCVRRQRTDAKFEFERTVALHLQAGPHLRYSGPLMQCRGVVVGFPSLALTKPFDLPFGLDSRIAIVGRNGAGKTTLLRTLAKDHAPLAGEVYVHPSLRVAYFSQHQAQMLPLEKTPLEVLSAFGEGVKERDAEDHLAAFGLDAKHARQLVGTLSGGEKSRLALAQITIKQPHVLLLDEPSNHLDLLTVAALSDALKAFQGGILLVSHDRRLIKEVCPEPHQQYLLDGGELRRADGLSKFVRSTKAAIKADVLA